MSLLTEIDDTNCNEDSSYETTTFNETADIENHNVPDGNNDEEVLA